MRPGDVVVVNTSATVPAAVDATTPDGTAVVVHISTELPTGLHLVEVRHPAGDGTTEPDLADLTGATLALPQGGGVHLLGRMPRSVRLWVATLDLPVPLLEYLCRYGRPIRYRYVPDSWPINAYTNAFATEPGSAEMPSAGRALTTDVITDLVAHGIVVAPIVLHTGVASLEAHETPYPERYRVPPATARLVNDVRRERREQRRHRGRHDCRAGARDGGRRGWVRASGGGLDRARRDARTGRARRSTACSPDGTSRKRAICGCSRPWPAARRWSLPTRLRCGQGIAGTNSATST